MQNIFFILTVLLGALHLVIMALELWGTPETQAKAFAMPLAFVRQAPARVSLVNQGIYNGALGAMFLFTCLLADNPTTWAVRMALAGFVLIVGLVGGFTATKKIFLIQCLPAVITLFIGWLAK
ncbi:DUF1304 domain-containing protein [Lacticaseibacillus porcinae]|uniref:DUF1304 domain-containing protein n=1 Tax=Lacticaseibacillus porcinae TaxID=1123687 RepID=UPI000F7B2C6A|nr:DUF1304 domain-containing protein [Lacticaseibacillus porcinae]